MNHDNTAPRDPRSDAPVVALDLQRPTNGDQTGWVYSGSDRVLARLVQS